MRLPYAYLQVISLAFFYSVWLGHSIFFGSNALSFLDFGLPRLMFYYFMLSLFKFLL